MQALHPRALTLSKSKPRWKCLWVTLLTLSWDPHGGTFHKNIQQEVKIKIFLDKQILKEFVTSRQN